MKLFACSACQQTVHFENSECTKCGHQLAYVPDRAMMVALAAVEAGSGTRFVSVGGPAGAVQYRRCGNFVDHQACNWAVPEVDSEERFCRACRLNEVIPNLQDPKAKQAWMKLEESKRRLIYTLLQLGLPLESRSEDPERGLAFAFKEDQPGEEHVTIGHDHGLITINIAEADSPFREKTRLELGESYRTLLGHFRHEIGHYYWQRLIGESPRLDAFRELFGDERAPYEQAMTAHYQNGAPPDWPSRFVSSYASMHPWEDWAESWAHYLHMVDTLDTARSFGLALRPQAGLRDGHKLEAGMRRVDFDDFDDLEAAWVPLTVALNSLNRSMGLPDPYPFALTETALRKIRFVHDVIEKSGGYREAG
jgi:hypothetical protein